MNATVRLSDFNALRKMFHELKDEFEALKMEKTMEAMAQKSGDASDQMMSLQCFNSKDMSKHDMEPGTFQSQVVAHLDHSSKEGLLHPG